MFETEFRLLEKEFRLMAQTKLAKAIKKGEQLNVASRMIADCLLSKSFNLAQLVLEECEDCDPTEILNYAIGKLTSCSETDLEMLAWLFKQGATGEIAAWERADAFSCWKVAVLEYFLSKIEFDAESFFIGYGEEIWVAVSARKYAADYYELLHEYGATPTNCCLQKALAEYPETTDVIWLVEHGCDPDLGTEESVWKDEAQSLIANLVCAYCHNTSGNKGKQLLTIEKLLEAGANPNAEIIPVEWALRFKGAKNLIDVALFTKKNDLIDLLSNYGAKASSEEERYDNYVRKMEEKLGLSHI